MSSRRPAILLIACYELGHQPLGVAWPAAFLRRAGLAAAALDLSIEPFDDELAAAASFVAISVPMHTALRIGLEAARRLRRLNPNAHICFHGLYAWLNRQYLLAEVADTVLAGEVEEQLVELARKHLHAAQLPPADAGPILARLTFPAPDRVQLKPIDQYARYIPAPDALSGQTEPHQLSGYVEASRGCLHTCSHCPIVPVYNGRYFVVPRHVVMTDIRRQIVAGAEHITFGDPDFLNGPKHALDVARALHAEFPHVTFDFTSKVEHILKYRALFAELAALGASYVVSAIESLSATVLLKLHKGHTAGDIDAALAILDSVNIAMQPTLVAFTPWTSLSDYLMLIEWILERGLMDRIPAVHLSIRLLIPPNSALLSEAAGESWLGELRPEDFGYRWTHPDPRMDVLQAKVAAAVEVAAQIGEPGPVTFARIRQIAYQAAGRNIPPATASRTSRRSSPRLTENWYCCAEPVPSQFNLQSFVPDSELRII
jgi:radical SAM superfamily enzyme YgiQ (UPF0313 family)